MSELPMELGRVVCSKAGRDAGRTFVVVALLDEQYVAVADGSLRKVDRPKKKKRRHLLVRPECISSLQQRLVDGLPVHDYEVRACLEAVKPHEEG